MHRLTTLALLALLLCPAFASAQRKPYTPEQLSLIRYTAECKLSPDGKTVAFVSDITGALELWTVTATGGWPNQLTNLNEQVSDIQWSPDGQWLVFTSDYGGNDIRDLYRVPAAGGEVEKLTDTKMSERQPRFSPDGKRLAFLADPDEDFWFQLHVMDLETRKVTQLTKEAIKVQYPVWSPHDKTIAVNRSGDDQKGDLLLVDTTSGAKVVVEPTVKDGILLPAAFSPDGKFLLLLARNKEGYVQLGLLGLEASGGVDKPPKPAGPPTFVGPGEWDVTEARWTKKGIFFVRNTGGASSLSLIPCKTGADIDRATAATIGLPSRCVVRQISADKDATQLALLFESVTKPADVRVLDLAEAGVKGNPRQITFSLLGGVKEKELAQGTMVLYESFDKMKIPALLVKPMVDRLGSPPPAIVYVHGGPDSQILLSFDPFIHVLAEAGFAVIAPNYRGSSGYGKSFLDANNKDWGGGDLKDLAAAVAFFGKRGDIDPKRVGITGGSYGGYMTLLALCKMPELWKAGVELYGMPDLVMDYMLSKKLYLDWYETEMGNPKTNGALFRERSPLLYLDDLKAPLLIFHGAGDTNVPKMESDLLVAVLKQLKKPHEYIVYEDEGHGFSKRKNLVDHYQRTAAFFVKHLQVKK